MKVTRNISLIAYCAILVAALICFAAVKSYHVIDAEKCTACASCVEECEDDAISLGKVGDKDVYIIDPAKCTNCGNCVDVCPEECISETEGEVAEAAKEEVKTKGKKSKKSKKK